MPPRTPVFEHVWITPAEFALLVDAHQHGEHWRAKCPVHNGGNPSSLKIWQGTDNNGNPKTSLKCFAHNCTQGEIVAVFNIPERKLYAVQEEWGKRPRGYQRSPWIEAWRKGQEPERPDQTALMLLCEMIVSDPAWIQSCAPARQKMWALAKSSVTAYRVLQEAVERSGLHPKAFWDILAAEQERASHDA